MPIKIYIKETYSFKQKIIKYISYLSLTLGAILLFWSAYPVISFQIYSYLTLEKKIVSPVPTTNLTASLSFANYILGASVKLSENPKDFTDASLWFPSLAKKVKAQAKKAQTKKLNIKEYHLSIPKLNIENALVKVGGTDLNKSLIHFLPKSLPGEIGNVAIFGHSTLPQLYKPNNYKSIFTYLHTLEKGDEIYVKVGSLKYVYEVKEMFVVEPDQIEVLEQATDDSYITLITCTPPGTYWKRLIVKAKLKRLP